MNTLYPVYLNTHWIKKAVFICFLFLAAPCAFAQVPSYVNTTGLLAWYNFNGNADNAWSLMDYGTLYGGATYGKDRFGTPVSCYVGNGSSSIDIPVNDFPLGNSARSVSAWFKSVLPYPGSDRQIIAWGDNSVPGRRFGVFTDGLGVGFESVGVGRTAPITLDSAWHHVVVTYPVGGVGIPSIKIYYDGVFAASTPIGALGSLNTATGFIHCMGTLFLAPSYLYSWVGSLDDIGVWAREISPCEVSYLYGNDTPAFTANYTQTVTLCENAPPYSINSILSVDDNNIGQTITWTTGTAPLHGTLTGPYGTVTTASTLTPVGLSYTPAPGYTGLDSFEIIVADCGGDADTMKVLVTINPLPDPGTISGPASVCVGNTITLTPTLPGGVWSSGGTAASVSGGVVTGLMGGTATISYSFTNSCGTASAVQTITVLSLPTMPTFIGSSIYCQYDPYVPPGVIGTGILWYTTPVGGVGTTMPPVVSTGTPGLYTIYASQTIAGCEGPRGAFTIDVRTKPGPPAVAAVPDTYCLNQPFVPFTIISGTALLWYNTPTGGTGNSTASTVNTAASGLYTFYVSQTVGGCEGPRTAVRATVAEKIVPDFSYNVRYGCKEDTVEFTNKSLGARIYTWKFGDGFSSILEDPTHIYKLPAIDTVILYATFATCTDSVVQYLDFRHPVQALSTVDTNLICQGKSITFTDDTSVGTGLKYLWEFGDYELHPPVTGLTATHTYPVAGVFNSYLVVIDFAGCTDTMFTVISVDSISVVDMALTDTVICRGHTITFRESYTQIGNVDIKWSLGNGDTIRGVNPLVYAYDVSGAFTVSATALYRVCPNVSSTRNVTVLPQPAINLGNDFTICKGSQPADITDIINNGNPNAKWEWSTGETTPFITVTMPGIYTATVTVNGCEASATIHVDNDCYIDIPNAFTPNGDGVNDYFFPRQYLTRGLTTFDMSIFNRWGQVVFKTNKLDGRGWDGAFNDVPQPQGVFVYQVKVTFKDGQKEQHTGNVTLLR